MIVNGKALLAAAPIADMLTEKHKAHGVSHGLTECGYDLTIKQEVVFTPPDPIRFLQLAGEVTKGAALSDGRTWEALAAFHGFVSVGGDLTLGRFALASAVERFQMPTDLTSILIHKSSWAREGVDVWAATMAEPDWTGFLTLELAFLGTEKVVIPAGSGIAQAVFMDLAEPASYGDGKYQDQEDRPVRAIKS